MSEIEGSCHCGAVRIIVPQAPAELLQCNCSLCRKTGWIGAYWDPADVRIDAGPGILNSYVQGDRTIRLWNCGTCGSHTHWTPLTAPPDRMGVNARMFTPGALGDVPVRLVDGAAF